MRQVLIFILLKHPFAWGERDLKTGVPGFGLTWFILAAFLVWSIAQWLRHKSWPPEIKQRLIPWGIALAAAAFVLPAIGPERLPIFGYGMMVLIGFLSGLGLARLRARRIGLDPEILSDMSFWLLVSGVAGGRLAHLVQFRETQYLRCKTVIDYINATVNLTEGGLVLIGAMVGGTIGIFLFCWLRKLPALLLLFDVIMPSVFVGIGFGRIGCLLNGCCFGAACDLPWAIQFPKDSVPWIDLVQMRKLDPNAAWTMPLHPTQIYSTIDGFMLGTILWNVFPLRTRNGQLFGMGCAMYACTRFFIESLRNDTLRMTIQQFGQTLMFWNKQDPAALVPAAAGEFVLTISQWYSLGIFVGGASLLLWLHKWGEPATMVVTNPALKPQ